MIGVIPDAKVGLAFLAHRAPFRESPGPKRGRKLFLCSGSVFQIY